MLKSVFGIPVKYETWNKKSSLPLYIANDIDLKSIGIRGVNKTAVIELLYNCY